MPLARHELWPLQEDGNLCKLRPPLCGAGLLLTPFVPKLQRAKPATKREMSQFHTDDYVEFLNRVTPDNVDSFVREQAKCTSTISSQTHAW